MTGCGEPEQVPRRGDTSKAHGGNGSRSPVTAPEASTLGGRFLKEVNRYVPFTMCYPGRALRTAAQARMHTHEHLTTMHVHRAAAWTSPPPSLKQKIPTGTHKRMLTYMPDTILYTHVLGTSPLP